VKPVSLCFVLHLHQPVGNFDHVIREHSDRVYRPLLERLFAGNIAPLGLHVSGPLLAWMEREDPALLEAIGGQVQAGNVELLTSGRYEPILASLSPADRLAQLEWMTQMLESRLGAKADTLWLTERVWEDAIVPELGAAGVRTVLVDDWHFRVSGFEPEQLSRPYHTEVGGVGLNLLPISESLRYLIPFSPAPTIVEHLRGLAEREVPFAAFADDGEKFGGWPGTWDWVWGGGWIDSFVEGLQEAAQRGWIELTTPSQAVARVPSGGMAYLGSASYREMEEWTLPPAAAAAYQRLLAVGDGVVGAGARIRGSHWRNFLVRYPQANRLHKKALALSRLARTREASDEVLHNIGRAQSNDPLWHGVFGGVYMKHLRDAAWRNLADAERRLRVHEPLAHEIVDLDYDGHSEIWIHSAEFSAVVSPDRGGTIEELTLFAAGRNEADVLTRHREAYHEPAVAKWADRAASDAPPATDGEESVDGAASIHDLELVHVLPSLPPSDSDPRSLVVARVLSLGADAGALEAGEEQPLYRFERDEMANGVTSRVGAELAGRHIVVEIERFAGHQGETPTHGQMCTKRIVFDERGICEVGYSWPTDCWPERSYWTVEVSQQADAPLLAPDREGDTQPARVSYPIVTVPRSERGFERIQQGHAHVFAWPVGVGAALLVRPSSNSDTILP